MPRFWLDADMFITSASRFYALDIAPTFWAFIEENARLSVISSPQSVYREIVKNGNESLRQWAVKNRDSALWVRQDVFVQKRYEEVVNWVAENPRSRQDSIDKFLAGADPWLIAHARQYPGKILTFEKPEPDARKVKIPDVCARFDVEITTPWAMLRSLGFSFK